MKTIKVCNTCGNPLIWTFCWAYKEYYCLNCDGHWGMLGAGKDVPETKELRKRDRQLNKLWKVIYKQLIPRCDYKKTKGCIKCSSGARSHREHLTKREILSDKVATKILNSLEGMFNFESNPELAGRTE